MIHNRFPKVGCNSLKTSLRTFAIPILKGRATEEGTRLFVAKSSLPMFHKFHLTDLYINPIIHGPPKYCSDANKSYVEALTARAVLKNRSNCIIVYQHNEIEKSWHSTNLASLFRKSTEVTRDQIVTIANLGLAANREQILERLYEAGSRTGLETIDMAVFNITEEVMSDEDQHLVEETLSTLKQLVHGGSLQSYGMQISVAPYTYHTPALETSGPLYYLPSEMEDAITNNLDLADLMLYPISPSISCPSTYPMLDADPEVWNEEAIGGESFEKSRRFTRGAVDPLVCKIGGAAGVKVFEAHRLQKRRAALEKRNVVIREEAERRRNEQIARKKLEEQEEEENVTAYAATTTAHMTQAVVEAENQPSEANSSNSSSTNNDTRHKDSSNSSSSTNNTIDDNDEVGVASDIANSSRSKARSISDYIKSGRKKEALPDGCEYNLITGLNPAIIERELGNSLDILCPALKSTPLLQDKALRIVFSAGVDVMIIDAEHSAMLGKFSLTPKDMITSDDTSDVFEKFGIPYEDEEEDE